MAEVTSSRAGDLARSERLTYSYSQAATQSDLAQFQATTGLKGPTYKDVGSETLSALSISIAKQGAEQYQDTMDLIDQRLGLAETAINKVGNVLEQFRTRLVGIVQTGSQDVGFQKFCQDALTEVALALNDKDIGRNNIFGGNEWDTAPVDLAALPVPTLGGGVSTNYYQGTQDLLSADINEGTTLEYGIKADNSGFAKTLHVLKIGATFIPDYVDGSNTTLLLKEALTTSEQAVQEVGATLAALGTDRATMDKEKRGLEAFVENANALEKKYIGADVTEAWIQLMALNEQLLGIATAMRMETEASKQLFADLR